MTTDARPPMPDASTYPDALPDSVCEACRPMPDAQSLTPRPPSEHFWHEETGESAEAVLDLVPNAILDLILDQLLSYVAAHIRTAWCWECHDTGVLGTSWGPNEGCREFIDGPEVWFCACVEGQMAKEDYERREAEDKAGEEARWEEVTERHNR